MKRVHANKIFKSYFIESIPLLIFSFIWAGMTFPLFLTFDGAAQVPLPLYLFLLVPVVIWVGLVISYIRRKKHLIAEVKEIYEYKLKDGNYVINLDAEGYENGIVIGHVLRGGDSEDRRAAIRTQMFLERSFAQMSQLFITVDMLKDLTGYGTFISVAVIQLNKMNYSINRMSRKIFVTKDMPYEVLVTFEDDSGFPREFKFILQIK